MLYCLDCPITSPVVSSKWEKQQAGIWRYVYTQCIRVSGIASSIIYTCSALWCGSMQLCFAPANGSPTVCQCLNVRVLASELLSVHPSTRKHKYSYSTLTFKFRVVHVRIYKCSVCVKKLPLNGPFNGIPVPVQPLFNSCAIPVHFESHSNRHLPVR